MALQNEAREEPPQVGSLSLGPPGPPQGDKGREPVQGGHRTEAGPWERRPEPQQAWDSGLSPTLPARSASYHLPGLPHEQVGWNPMSPPQLPGDAPVPATEPERSGFSAGAAPPRPRPRPPEPLLLSAGEPEPPGLLVEGWAQLQGPRLHSLRETLLQCSRPAPPSASRAQKDLPNLLRRFWA